MFPRGKRDRESFRKMFNSKKMWENMLKFSVMPVTSSEVDVEIGSRTRGVNIRDSLMRQMKFYLPS